MPRAAESTVREAFFALVNMDAEEISRWLEGEESRTVGYTRPGEVESVGRMSARKILTILAKPTADLDRDDYAHMRKVVGFIRRHRGQGPHDPYRIPFSRWRYSLMNWGHDPLKDMPDFGS